MNAAPGSHHARQPRPVLPTSHTYTDIDTASTDMTSDDGDDDDSSVQSDSSDAGDVEPTAAAATIAAPLPNGGSFDGAFAAFNIGRN